MSKIAGKIGSLAALSLAAVVASGQFVPPVPRPSAGPTSKPLAQEIRDAEQMARMFQELRNRTSPTTRPMPGITLTTRPTARIIPLPLATDSKTIPIPTDISKASVKPLGDPIPITIIMPTSDSTLQSTLPAGEAIIPAP